MTSLFPNTHDADPIRTLELHEFKRSVLEASGPILACFIPEDGLDCQHLIEGLKGVAAVLDRSVEILRIDPQASPELTDLFNVTSFPDLILFHRGRIIRRFTGVTTDWRLLAAIQEAVR